MNLTDYKKIKDIPKRPGVYFWKKEDQILYIGKATNLSQRTASYLGSKLMVARGPLIVKMIEEADSLFWRETESVLEALILETNLIKKEQPKYNSKEKDNKSHNYVVVTKDEIPRIYTVRGRNLNSLENKGLVKKYFGPFPQGKLLIEALKIIKKIFPFLGKKKNSDQGNEFYKQIGLSPDLSKKESIEEYKKNISYIELLLSGKKRSIIQKLKKEMLSFSKNLEFEKAARMKNKIYALEHIRDIALLKHDFEINSDALSLRIEAYDIAHLQGDAMLGTMVVHNGVDFENDQYRIFNIKKYTSANDPGALSEVLDRRLKHKEWPKADIIIVDGGVTQKRAMEKTLREHDLKIPVLAVVKDERHRPKGVLGRADLILKYKKHISEINSESHRFTIQSHKKLRDRKFLI